MTDRFREFNGGLDSPPISVFEVTPSDTDDLQYATRCINVAESGTVQVTTVDGSTATLMIAAGVVFPIRVSRIWATGTTATGIVAML